jgi:hypothetical protein
MYMLRDSIPLNFMFVVWLGWGVEGWMVAGRVSGAWCVIHMWWVCADKMHRPRDTDKGLSVSSFSAMSASYHRRAAWEGGF